jgi:hypothetical protein
MDMKAYSCNDHDGHWPVGVASIIIANDEEHAIKLLDSELKTVGLKPYKDHKYTLKEIDTNRPNVIVLNDGNY